MSDAQQKPGQSTGHAVASPYVEDYCWHPDGWECAGESSVRDARTTTRAEAAAAFAFNGHDFIEVRVWKRYIERFTIRGCWEWYATASLGEPGKPMPDGWQPQEDAPVWRFVARGYPGAIPVWVCGAKGDEPPAKPHPGQSDAGEMSP